MGKDFFKMYETFKFSYSTKDKDIDALVKELEKTIKSFKEPSNEIVNTLFKIVMKVRFQISSNTNYSNKLLIESKFDEFENILMKFFAISTVQDYNIAEQEVKEIARIYQSMLKKE